MRNKKSYLSKTIADARKELDKIECKESLTKNKKLLGKCFKFNNGYSGSNRWSVFIKVLYADANSLKGIVFETDCNGEQKISFDNFIAGSLLETKITQEEFDIELNLFILRLKTLLKDAGQKITERIVFE
mgnify:CR=1 FL=1